MRVSLFNLEGISSNVPSKSGKEKTKLLVVQENQKRSGAKNLHSPRRAEGGIRGKLVSARKRARVAVLAFSQKCRAYLGV